MRTSIVVRYASSKKTGKWYLSLGFDLGYAYRPLCFETNTILEILGCSPRERERVIELVTKSSVPGADFYQCSFGTLFSALNEGEVVDL